MTFGRMSGVHTQIHGHAHVWDVPHFHFISWLWAASYSICKKTSTTLVASTPLLIGKAYQGGWSLVSPLCLSYFVGVNLNKENCSRIATHRPLHSSVANNRWWNDDMTWKLMEIRFGFWVLLQTTTLLQQVDRVVVRWDGQTWDQLMRREEVPSSQKPLISASTLIRCELNMDAVSQTPS